MGGIFKQDNSIGTRKANMNFVVSNPVGSETKNRRYRLANRSPVAVSSVDHRGTSTERKVTISMTYVSQGPQLTLTLS